MESCGVQVPITVVVAEDDEDDRLLIAEAFRANCQCLTLHFTHDGVELLEYLTKTEVSKPCLILIDLNMPKMGGIEAVEKIKSNDKLKDIPIIVLTTSDDEETVAKSYCSGANSYIRKPMSFSQLEHIVDIIGKYWCEVVLLPGRVGCGT
ncbi:MAG: response regulator [Syntrophobacteraceae bacterium]